MDGGIGCFGGGCIGRLTANGCLEKSRESRFCFARMEIYLENGLNGVVRIVARLGSVGHGRRVLLRLSEHGRHSDDDRTSALVLIAHATIGLLISEGILGRTVAGHDRVVRVVSDYARSSLLILLVVYGRLNRSLRLQKETSATVVDTTRGYLLVGRV